jgi:DNA-binding PadR family transcriptional regulator
MNSTTFHYDATSIESIAFATAAVVSTKRSGPKMLPGRFKVIEGGLSLAKPMPPCMAARLYYVAKFGWSTFPANLEDGEKKSYKSEKYSGGAKWGHTIDAAVIRNDANKFPDHGVGVPTGRVNKVIDIETDTPKGHGVDGSASLTELEAELGPLPDTLAFESPTASRHRLYNYPKDVGDDVWIKTIAGELGTGIDVKADGGMMIAPPSVRPGIGEYRWCNGLPMADLPEAWIKRILELLAGTKQKEDERSSDNITASEADDDPYSMPTPREVAYAQAALDGVADELAKTEPGKRNATLNSVAYRMGRMVAKKWIERKDVETELLNAAHACGLVSDDGEDTARATIKSGLKAGMKKPLDDLSDKDESVEAEINIEATAKPWPWTSENGDRIKEALGHIPLGHRVDDVGKGLYALRWVEDYYDWGLDAWDQWSKWDDAYIGFKDLQARWQSFLSVGKTTEERDAVYRQWFATLIEIAREHGWKDASAETTKAKLLQSSAQFVEGYVPPDYLVDGLLQRRYVYSLTAPTGSGKTAIALRIAFHVALGLPLAGREVEKGRVLFFAGENPDDVRSRWIKQCEEMGYDPKDIDVFFMPFTIDLEKFRKQINAETVEHGPFSLLIVDTSAAYYTGNDENDNVALGNHARMLRTFVNLPGGPTILVTCHPTKTPNMENLLPRGGGAFLAEVDGNLVCLKQFDSMVVEITWHGKFRGPDFKSFSFKLVPGQSDKLIDTKGRNVWTITAHPISDAEQEQIEEAGSRNQDELLRTMLDFPGLSVTELTDKLSWTTVSGEPNKSYVYRMLKDLTKQKLAEKQRNNHYALTKKGTEVAGELPEVKYIKVTPISDEERSKGPRAKVHFDQPEGVSFMITKDQKQQLLDLGYDRISISHMTPERAHNIIEKGQKPRRY